MNSDRRDHLPGSSQAVYAISVAAELAGVGVQTLRLYEQHGLLTPARSAGTPITEVMGNRGRAEFRAAQRQYDLRQVTDPVRVNQVGPRTATTADKPAYLATVAVTPDPDLPRGPFGAKSTAEEVTAGIDLSGRTALVTGATSGLGFETLRVLALRGAHVYGTGRTLEKATEAFAGVTGNITPLALELEDFQSAVACAQALHAAGVVPDIVILNAGAGLIAAERTSDPKLAAKFVAEAIDSGAAEALLGRLAERSHTPA